MRNIFTLVILFFYSLSSIAQTDAKVRAIYTLAQIPAPLGVYNYVIQARVVNAGAVNLVDLPVVLNVTGANLFTDSQRVSIDVGDTVLVSFKAFSPWTQGNNTAVVSVPADDDNTNNSAAYPLVINNNLFSYADDSPAVSSTGYGTGAGMLLTRYQVTGSCIVKQVKVYISDQPSNVGNTVYGVVLSSGSIVSLSDAHIVTAAELATYITMNILTPPEVDYEFYAGLLQTANVLTPYNPVGVQAEGIPSRPDAYYASNAAGSSLTPLTFFGRLMIQAVVDIGTVTPFNFTITTPNRVLAAWDLSGTSSSAFAAATTYDTLFSSSNLLIRGPGAPVSPGFHSFSTNGFQNTGISTSSTSFYQLTLSTKTGDTLSLNSLNGTLHGNNANINNAPITSQFAYSTDGVNYTLIASPFETASQTGSFNVYLADIPALQNIVSGTTVYLRYYASGEAAATGWGFLSYAPGYNALAVYGKLATSNSILTAPVEPTGSPFLLADCSSSPQGSISFTSIGSFSPTNKYIVQLGLVSEPHSNTYRFNYPVNIGALSGNANSGSINFTIPAGSNDNTSYAIRVISTEPYIEGSFTQLFQISGGYCHSQPNNYFRSRTSGDWADPASWESSDGNTWIPATLAPTEAAAGIEISRTHVITLSTNTLVANMHVKGTLRLLNGNGSKGTIGFVSSGAFVGTTAMTVDTGGVFEVASHELVYYDAMLKLDGNLRIYGTVSIGNGTDPVAPGFDAWPIEETSFVRWSAGAVFDWNNMANAPRFDTTYFPGSFSTPTFRITSLPSPTLGAETDLTMNALLEVNTAVELGGSGLKTFRDGIKGTSVLTQMAGCGTIFTDASFGDFAAGPTSAGTQKGILGGSVQIQLSDAGLTLREGAIIPDSAKVFVTGKAISLQKFELFPGGKFTLNNGSALFIENADLINSGQLDGPGIIKFTGDQLSQFTSPGVITAPTVLINKQLGLGGNSNIADLDLSELSNLSLNAYNLNMSTATLNADSANFIVTNDTGRLNRYVASTAVSYPVGINNTSYTPATIINSGNPAEIKVRVTNEVLAATATNTPAVDRTWLIGDSAQTGCNLSIALQWNSTDEQANFARDNAYISHLVGCGDPLNCPDGAYDDILPSMATATGNSSYRIQRTGINNFYSPAFIVSSRPLVYTFTGDGDWDIPSNWTPALVAPSVISEGIQVSIDPVPAGECVRNGNIKVLQGGKLTVQPGKKLTVTGALILE